MAQLQLLHLQGSQLITIRDTLAAGLADNPDRWGKALDKDNPAALVADMRKTHIFRALPKT